MTKLAADRTAWTLLALASGLLAWEPLTWLLRSWTSPAYGSQGYVFVALVAALAGRSLLSGPATGPVPARFLGLLALAALARLASQTLAIGLLGGLALAVDVYALVVLLRLDRRPFALSPFWMAALFVFSLPVEAVLERAVGYPLQIASARIACGLLGVLFDAVACAGVRLTVEGRDVLVDLPCSGASGLLLSAAFLVAMNAVHRPRPAVALAAGLGVLALAVLGNGLRIVLLASGLVHGLDAMAEPMHAFIGIATLVASLAPVALWYRPRARAPRPCRPAWRAPTALALPGAALAALLAFWIVSLPGRPVDVSRAVAPQPFPAQIAGWRGRDVPLTPMEALYLERYGGQARKARFGPLGLNLVSTTSPLRHLHAPETCLRGLGYAVAFLGTRYEGTPSAVYRAEGPDGAVWRVAVSFVSDDGRVTPSVGEAIWHWMGGRGRTWRSVQRITPWSMPAPERARLDRAALAALDIPHATQGDLR